PLTASPTRRSSDLPRGNFQRRGNQVIHERPAQTVTFVIETDHLHQRHTDALGQASLHLTFDNHRVDARSAVIDGNKAPDRDLGGAGIDVDDTDVRAKGVRQIFRVVAYLRLKTAFDPVGKVVGAVGLHGNILNGHGRPRVTFHLE